MKKLGTEKNLMGKFFESVGKYIRKKYKFLIMFFLAFLALSALSFFKVSTSESISNFSLSDFEIGQVADRNITANKTLAPDECIARGCTLYAAMNSPYYTIMNFSFEHYNPYSVILEYPYYNSFIISSMFSFLAIQGCFSS